MQSNKKASDEKSRVETRAREERIERYCVQGRNSVKECEYVLKIDVDVSDNISEGNLDCV